MKIDEIIYSLKNLWHRKLRSFLTILSILIGIAAIFAIISFGLGIKEYMDVLAEEAGTDTFYIMSKGVGAPGSDETFSLSSDEVEYVKKVKGVYKADGMYMKAGELKFGKEKKYSFVMGMDISNIDFILKAFGIDITKGRQLKKGETSKVVLGYLYQIENKVFKKAVKLGDKVEINSYDFEVIGFYEEVGNPSDDSQIYITMEAFEMLYPSSKNKFGYVLGKAEKNVNPEELADKIKEKLRKFKDEEKGKETFYVQTFADAMETFGMIINILNGILVLIALISLVVAAVNIMNTMYTAVLERTKEIGVMKAIGAQNNEILLVFVFESGFLGFLGGVAGVILGFLISFTGGKIAAGAGFAMLKPVFPWYLILSCLLFATLVGASSGFLPAIRASKQNPVDALRYE